VGGDLGALTVVVPTRDRPALLEGCLAALRGALRGADRVIVVDSASRSDATGRVATAAGFEVIRCDGPGASRARNLGAVAASTEIVAFVDDDVRVTPGWAEAIAAAFGPEISFVTCRTVPPPHQAAAERPVALKDEPTPARLDAATTGALGHGASLAVRRSALLSLGGFDERLGPGRWLSAGEDQDLLDRMVTSGLVGRYEPDALAWHEQWRDRPTLLRLDWNYGKGTGGRLAKLRRSDRRRAVTVAVDALWRNGLADAAACARRGYRFGTLSALARTAGTLAGFPAGLVLLRPPARGGA